MSSAAADSAKSERVQQAVTPDQRHWVRRCGRYLRTLEWLARLPSIDVAYAVASRLGSWGMVCREDPAQIKRRMMRHTGRGAGQVEEAVRRYVQNVGVSDFTHFLFRRLTPAWREDRIRVIGDELLSEPREPSEGLMVMIYHHHHNGLLFVTLGLLGHQIEVIAMDPRLSPQYPFFPRVSERWYADSEAHFNGGHYQYARPEPSYLRDLYRVLGRGGILVTTNDFLMPGLPRRLERVRFLGKDLELPAGSVEIALRQGARVVTAHVLWLGGARFELRIQPVDTAGAVAAVMQQYMDHLAAILQRHPEAWRWSAMMDD
jgi:lauroyl/myristoyl acyltransferase